jgi:hypothetical protein
MDRNEIPHDPCHLGVPFGASKMIFEPMVCSAQIVHLVKISTISKWTKMSFHLSLVTLEFLQVRPKWFSSLWYIRCKQCTYIAPTLTLPPNGPKRDSTWPTHLGVPSGMSKTISEPMVRSAQTVHLSSMKISTISKRTQTSFHLNLVT